MDNLEPGSDYIISVQAVTAAGEVSTMISQDFETG